MQTVIILRGAPGCGKTSWAKKYCNKHEGWVNLEQACLKSMFGSADKKLLSFYTDIEMILLKEALNQDLNVIIDNPIVTETSIAKIVEIVDSIIKEAALEGTTKEIKCIIKNFSTPLNICLLRNSMRDNPKKETTVVTAYNFLSRKMHADNATSLLQRPF